MVGPCEHDSETWGSIMGGNFLSEELLTSEQHCCMQLVGCLVASLPVGHPLFHSMFQLQKSSQYFCIILILRHAQ
jgi:hypothetical protein